MRIVARQARSSTCPLCRDTVIRARGVACATCGSRAHPDCVREFGGCHSESPQSSLLEARRHLAQLQELACEGDATREQPLTAAQKVGLWSWGLVLVAAAITVAIQSGGKAALATGFLGLIGPVGLLQFWEGLTTGRVETTAKHSSEIYSFAEQPIRFLFHLTFWLVMGVGLTAAAAAPLFVTGW